MKIKTFIATIRVLTILLGSICIVTLLAAQEKEPQHFDKTKWKNLTRNLDYSKEYTPKANPGTKPDIEVPLLNLSNPVKIILFTLLIVVLAFLVIWIISSNSRVKVKENDFKIDFNEEAGVSEWSIELLRKHLDEELKAGNYRMALRIYYLLIIKTLHDKGFILWKKEKTNRQYIQELKGKEAYMDFAYLTRTYELVWYGDRHFEAAYLQDSCGAFEKFLTTIDLKN